ncbi:MAG: DUF6446 family protein [Paracoccaceae bacterium]|nr:DUF6446 family protein [Paracoccaceae bacterium]MDG1370519.1 DUF6446 family protein [Paracoccaceae bacterium]
MSGRTLMIGLIGFSLIFGAVLWYYQTRGWYEPVENLTSIVIDGQNVAVTDYQGIDAATSPLKLRGCFTMEPAAAPVAERPDPLIAPGWFDCFDAETIATDIASGAALPLLAEFNTPYGFDRIVAYYPDGHAFQWRQINACGKAEFAGDPLPDGCPEAPAREKD